MSFVITSRLSAAYDWVQSAGEIPMLVAMTEADAEQYADECEANAVKHGVSDVTARDIVSVWRVLQ